jgi:hypothetical protein
MCPAAPLQIPPPARLRYNRKAKNCDDLTSDPVAYLPLPLYLMRKSLSASIPASVSRAA